MAIKALLIDFYGTAVEEDDSAVQLICEQIYDGCQTEDDLNDILQYWWNEYSALFTHAYGEGFDLKRNLMIKALESTIESYGSAVNAKQLAKEMFTLWQRPAIYPDTKAFFESARVPICIVSNADRKDIDCALTYHKLTPDLVITSEDAGCYKPRSEIFLLALEQLGLAPNEVIHIGDTISTDVVGAFKAGIDVVWLNRRNKEISQHLDSTMVCSNLLDVFKLDYPFDFPESRLKL